MATKTGSLIELHYHDNKNILDLFSQNQNEQLLFNGKLVDAALSAEQDNAIIRKQDGLFVDGSIIKDFAYKNGILLFKGTVVSQEYDERSVRAMVYDIWKEYDEKQQEEAVEE